MIAWEMVLIIVTEQSNCGKFDKTALVHMCRCPSLGPLCPLMRPISLIPSLTSKTSRYGTSDLVVPCSRLVNIATLQHRVLRARLGRDGLKVRHLIVKLQFCQAGSFVSTHHMAVHGNGPSCENGPLHFKGRACERSGFTCQVDLVWQPSGIRR